MTEGITLEDYKIVQILRKAKLTDADIAHRCGWTPTHVRNIRNTPFHLLE